MIDSPGHVDFSSEVTAALRVTDGALVVVDAVEGVCVQTDTVLRQAMQERIKPVLMINKVDRSLIDMQLDGEEIYQQFNKIIEKINITISTYESEAMGNLEIDPSKGNVAFGSGKGQWGFTLQTFARFYAKKCGLTEEKMMEKMWGDNYYDKSAKKWTNSPEGSDGSVLKRAFVQYVMEPVSDFFKTLQSEKQEEISVKLEKLKVELTQEERS